MQKYLLSLIFIGMCQCLNAQQLQVYSMYMFNGLVLNPAYAGKNGALTAMLHYRDQWSSFEGHPTTYSLVIDSPLRNKKFNLGAIFSYDKFGISHHTEFIQSFNYRQHLTENSELSAGFQAGFTYLKMDYSELNAPPEDQVFSVNPRGTLIPKIGFGLNYIFKRFYIGASMPQLNISSLQDSSLIYYTSPVYFLTSGYTFQLNKDFQLKPSLLFKFTNSGAAQLDVNAMATFKNTLSVGASYRNGNALVLLMEAKFHQLKFGYAYDHYLNSLKSVSKGSHELMLKYEFRYLMKVTDPRNFY